MNQSDVSNQFNNASSDIWINYGSNSNGSSIIVTKSTATTATLHLRFDICNEQFILLPSVLYQHACGSLEEFRIISRGLQFLQCLQIESRLIHAACVFVRLAPDFNFRLYVNTAVNPCSLVVLLLGYQQQNWGSCVDYIR